MITSKLFLASSSELEEDRKEFEIFIGRKNKSWIARGVFLELVVWEDFLDAVSQTRLQDEYNKEIRQCDVFIMLFSTKVGQYTEEEFKTAFEQFKATQKPLLFTFFKDTETTTGTARKNDLMSLWAFQEKLSALGHFYTVYRNIDDLKFKFDQRLEKLSARGFFGSTTAAVDREAEPQPVGREAAATQSAKGDEEAESRRRGRTAEFPVGLPRSELADPDRISRSPIVIAIEELADPLRDEELLQTERHLTITLPGDAAETLLRLSETLGQAGLRRSELLDCGRRVWRVLSRVQPRLKNLLERVAGSALPQPVAWTGRTALLVALHRPLLCALESEKDDIEKIFSIGCGAHYFNPIASGRQDWQVHRRPAEEPAVGVCRLSSGEDARARLLEATSGDVAVLTGDRPGGLWELGQAVLASPEPRIRVAVALGPTVLDAARIDDALRGLTCLSAGSDVPRDESLAEALREAFEYLGRRQAAPCILAAVRRRQLAAAHATHDDAAFARGLFWTTWSWIGRPLFSEGFGQASPPAAYPHLMDLRSPAAKEWYFPRRKGIPLSYQADEMVRSTADLFHLYLTGAGGTGKSCFLDHIYKQYSKRPNVLAVFYRVDVPSAEWSDLQQRILQILGAAARTRFGDRADALVATELQDLRDVLAETVARLEAGATGVKQIVLFIDQLERTFESGDEPDYGRLERISDSIGALVKAVGVGAGVRIFIASRKQYLPDFLGSFRTAADCHLEFNVLQTVSDQTEQVGFINHVLKWCQQENLVANTVKFDPGAAEILASKVKGHPLNMMLALIQVLSHAPTGAITQQLIELKEYRPWEKLFHLDIQLANKDDVDWFFLLAMAHARSEIVRQEEIWWRIRLVELRLTRRVEELRPSGVLERLWLLGFLGRTIYPRDFAGQPARYLEFFHANLRDYLLQLMGQGGGEIDLPRRRCETPPAWRALDRLSIAAREWEQTQQLLPADDVAFLMEQREVTVEKAREGGWWASPSGTAFTEQPPFYLLFLRDIEHSRAHLCKAASECFAFSALVHDNLGRWAIEKLFVDIEERIDCCRRWLERCARDSRAAILRYLIELQSGQATELICNLVLAEPATREAGGPAPDVWKDVATLVSRPLYAARYRADVVASVVEASLSRPGAGKLEFGWLPMRVREFMATACNADANDLTKVVAHCVARLRVSHDVRARDFGGKMAGLDHEAWLAGVPADPILYSAFDPRERASRTRAPAQLCLGKSLRETITPERLEGWLTEVSRRLGIPLPDFELIDGSLADHEAELRLHGQGIAMGEFYPGRTQILQRHWRRGHGNLPSEGFEAQNDALQELVLWVDPALLKQVSWQWSAHDFDGSVVDWLEFVLRHSVDRYFGFDLLSELLNDITALSDMRQLFRGVSLQLLRQVVVNLVQERVPLADHQAELITELQQLVVEVKDAEIVTQKLREHVNIKQALCRSLLGDASELSVLTLDQRFEESLANQIVTRESGRFLRIDPERGLALAAGLRAYIELHHENDINPVLACIPTLRHPLSSMLRRFDPRISVLSFSELPLDIPVAAAGLLTDGRSAPGATPAGEIRG